MRRTCLLYRHTMAGAALAAACLARHPAAAQDDLRWREGILVLGQRDAVAGLPGVEAEQTYSDDDVSARGSGTIGDFVDDVTSENGDDDPVFLVNGQQVSGLDDIADYPAEAIGQVQVLPRGSGQRLGLSPASRVYNIVLKSQVRSVTATAGLMAPTDGGLAQERGEALFTRIRGQQRINLALRVRTNDSLFESDRDLAQPEQAYPYAIAGNILPYPLDGGEIDPALSGLAGYPVGLAAVPPDTAEPKLAQFAALAGQANTLDEGRFRTLRPASRTYEASLSAADRIGPHLTASFVARLADTRDDSLLGLPRGLFVLPGASTVSPFGNDVTLALAGPESKRNRADTTRWSLDGTLNYVSGQWLGDVQLHFDQSDRVTTVDRQASSPFAPMALPAGYVPFAAANEGLFPLARDRIASLSTNRRTSAQLAGPLARLPAGFLRLRGRAEFQRATLEGVRRSSSGVTANSFARNAANAQLGIDLPIASRAFGFLPWLGEMSASVDFTRSHLSRQGRFDRQAFALAWQPVAQLNLAGSISRSEQPLDVDLLADPIEVYDNVRTFDPLTGKTVEVRQTTGGNPALRTPVLRETFLSASLVPWTDGRLRLDASFRGATTRGFASYLPPASLELLQAFPDRFVRDISGTLVAIDVRPVSLAAKRRQELKLGANLMLPVGRERDEGGSRTGGKKLQLSLTDAVALRDRVEVVGGGPAIDLLHGGAIGFGGASPRHQVSGIAGIGGQAWGLRLAAQWQSGTRLETGTVAEPQQLRFKPVFEQNLRFHADLEPLFPRAAPLRKTRITLQIDNLGNQRQRVVDGSGATPLRYQPGYRDPLGRTATVELRKTF